MRVPFLPAAAIFLALLGGCAPPPSPVPTIPWTAEELLARLDEQASRQVSLTGTARLRVVTPARTEANTLALVLLRPDRLRADILSPFGQPMLQLAAREGALEVYAPGEREVYRGLATAESLFKFTRLPLQLEDAVAFVLYSPPVLAYQGTRLVYEEGELRLWLEGLDSRRQTLVFDAQGRLLASRYFQGDTLLLDVAYSDFAQDPADFPQQLRLLLPLAETDVQLRLSKFRLNPDIGEAPFRLQWPAGTPILPLP